MVWKVTASVLDGEGKTSPLSFYLDSTLTAAQVETAAQAIIEKADVLMLGAIQSVTASYVMDISGWTLTGAPAAQSNRSYKGRFMHSTATGFINRVSLPTFSIIYVLPNSPNIDQAHADVAAFLTAFLAQSTVDERDEALTALQKAYEVFGQ